MRAVAEQVILVTGATDGLGKGLALELARAGAAILLHGRDPGRGRAAIDEIRDQTGNDRLSFYRADFASLADVREVAARVLAEQDRLDALVNNAGIGVVLPGHGERHLSADGYELRFQVNYLAGFLLTRLLAPLLLASAPARIVNVSSAGQLPLDFDDLMLERDYTGLRAYGQSKLAQIMFTFDLADELRDRGATATCLHPATFMPTKMVFAAGIGAASTLQEGVTATRRLVADPALEGVTGRYFEGIREARADPQAYDRDARWRLRAASEELVGIGPSPDDRLRALYAAFNARDVEAVLAAMVADVDWPNAWQGGRLVGRAAVRDYWTRQWAEIDPHVEPVSIVTRPDGRVAVEARQVVRGAGGGELLSEAMVVHVYELRGGLVARMDVEEWRG